jgi:LAO/AO transport system kinase
MADILAVNKADGDRLQLANQARAHYINATHLFPLKSSGWTPRVLTCSALDHTGIAELWQALIAYRDFTTANGFFDENRRQQAQYWFREALQGGLLEAFYNKPGVKTLLDRLEPDVLSGKVSPFAAAAEILKFWNPAGH